MINFDSEFANVRYSKEDNIVLLTWKKEAHLGNYREPTLYALDLLRNNLNSNFIVDARDGFEDDQRDVEWGFNFLLPQMAETSCKFVGFIMNEENDIAEEMDMWTVEFGKYFAVTRAADYIGVVSSMNESIFAHVKYSITAGKREAFIHEIKSSNIIEASRKEPGNISYEMLLPLENDDEIAIIEMWTNQSEQKKHTQTAHYKLLTELKEKYVETVGISCYKITEKM